MSEDITAVEPMDEGWDQFSKFANALKSCLNFAAGFDENAFVDKFKTLTDNRSRVGMCLSDDNLVKGVHQFVEELIHSNDSKSFAKSSEESLRLRQKADQCFENGLFSESLGLYAEAISCAPLPTSASDESTPISLAFGGRSQVLFRVEDYESCLADIEEALRYHCAEDHKRSLLVRKVKCLANMAKVDLALKVVEDLRDLTKSSDKSVVDEMEAEIDKLLVEINVQKEEKNDGSDDGEDDQNEDQNDSISSPNPLLPNASDAVRLEYNASKGRFVTAVKDISFGETLIVEQPFVTYLYSDKLEDYCNHCLTLLDNHWIACSDCTQIRYCGHSCREKAWSEYHSSECKTLFFLSKQMGISYLVLRILIKTGIDDVIRISNQLSQSTDRPKPDALYSSNYDSIFQLLDHQNDHNLDSMISYSLTAIFILLVLEKSFHIEKDNRQHLAEVILKHIQQLSTNLISILEQNFEEDFNKFGFDGNEEIIGTGIYPTISLLNHSCDPNILTFFNGRQMTVKTSKSIKAGEEVNYCYGPNFQRMSRRDRQNKLKSQYYFECQCFVCANHKENLTRALLCRECNGPVVHNQDLTGQCLSCKSSASDIKQTMANVEKGTQYSAEGLDLLNKQRLGEAVVALHKADELLTNNLYIQNRLLCKSKDDLCRCYASMGHFDRAVAYCRQSVRITGLVFGEESTESLMELMKLVSLKWELLDETEESETKKSLARDLLEVIARADNIASKFKSTEGFENAFQSELHFLNEKRLSVLTLV